MDIDQNHQHNIMLLICIHLPLLLTQQLQEQHKRNTVKFYILQHNSPEGAYIPKCANGTNIVIPLLGHIRAEDMAVNGAGARLNGQDAPVLSLLYDFEELEEDLDFLTQVVAITFYPAPSGRPITLGELHL